MSLNPYESNPVPEPPRWTPSDFGLQPSYGRPIGVTVLSVLHFVHALFIVGIVGLAMTLADDEDRSMLTRGLGFTFFIAGVSIAIGIGLWQGKNWGWRCASFYYIAQLVEPLINVFAGHQPRPLSLIEAVVGIVCFWYIFRDSVLQYFGMYVTNKIALAARIFGICTVLLLVLSLGR